MGGNVTAITNDGVQTKAEKIPVKEMGLTTFRSKFKVLFQKMNFDFYVLFKKNIWNDLSIINSGYVFNGSTSFLMDPTYDDKILNIKATCGDIDITVPDGLKEKLWVYLRTIEHKEIVPGIIYAGSNKPTIQSIGEQINAVFILKINGKSYNCQVDFEFLPYKDAKPTDWAKFSHSSNIVDSYENIKAVHHKFLIRSLVGSSSYRDDIIICTKKSTRNNITISKSKLHEKPRMYKFSVGKGLRVAYEPMIDEFGMQIIHNGKKLYRDVDSKESYYITDIREICEHSFLQESVSNKDLEQFNSFIGCLCLMRKYLSRELQQETHDRYIELLWGNPRGRAQELEAGNAELDLEIKMNGYKKFISMLQLSDQSSTYLDSYYEHYGMLRK